MTWWQRLWRKRQQEKRLEQELRFHFESQVADNLRAGMSEEDARRRAWQLSARLARHSRGPDDRAAVRMSTALFRA